MASPVPWPTGALEHGFFSYIGNGNVHFSMGKSTINMENHHFNGKIHYAHLMGMSIIWVCLKIV